MQRSANRSQQGGSGGNIDVDFAQSNWDSSSDSDQESAAEPKSNSRGSRVAQAEGKPGSRMDDDDVGSKDSKAGGPSNRFLVGVIGEGVKPDANWLEDDFDN